MHTAAIKAAKAERESGKRARGPKKSKIKIHTRAAASNPTQKQAKQAMHQQQSGSNTLRSECRPPPSPLARSITESKRVHALLLLPCFCFALLSLVLKDPSPLTRFSLSFFNSKSKTNRHHATYLNAESRCLARHSCPLQFLLSLCVGART